jgi:hypothetical protein
MNATYQKIVSTDNVEEILNIQRDLYTQKMKMDKFFSMYLDKFEGKMDPDEPDTQIWKLYKLKLKEYDAINQSIKAATYYANKRSASI